MSSLDKMFAEMDANGGTLSARKKARKMAQEMKRQIATGPAIGYDGKPKPEPQTRGDEKGAHKVVNETSSAIDWLHTKRHLDDPTSGVRDERELNAAASAGWRRKTASEKIEGMFNDAQITILKSPDLEFSSGGGFGPRTLGMSAMVAQMTIQEMRKIVPPDLMRILEQILLENDHVWHNQGKEARDHLLKRTRMALDMGDWALIHARKGRASEAMERALKGDDRRVLDLRRRWPDIDEWFRRVALDRAMHLAATIRSDRADRKTKS